ncbi:hypothetical protein [Geomicrobium sp. JCM 19038]|uniref:hypothetical protein n=1 Tax=Geomicrobium sp. JCM 19038 TaxID=1460635 RepID=UPI0005A6E33C|nr:hypothetical protein [Geomicrobium sp. JCM 19038]
MYLLINEEDIVFSIHEIKPILVPEGFLLVVDEYNEHGFKPGDEIANRIVVRTIRRNNKGKSYLAIDGYSSSRQAPLRKS